MHLKVSVLHPRASGLCYCASQFCSNLLDKQVKSFEEFKLQTSCQLSMQTKNLILGGGGGGGGLVEMTSSIHASYSLPEWQAVTH